MTWTDIKQKWPFSNTEVIICYRAKNEDELLTKWQVKIVHEKMIEELMSNDQTDIYWTSLPEIYSEKINDEYL